MSGAATSIMSIVAWCNLKLEGKNERKRAGNLELGEMIEAMGIQNTNFKRTAARTVLMWSWFAENSMYGPLLMFTSKTTGSKILKVQYKSAIGKFIRWLKTANRQSFDAQMSKIYSLLIRGKPESLE